MRYKTTTTEYVEAITFDEFVEYGKKNTDNIVDGMPWSFEYRGHNITHETNTHYLVITEFGETINFTSEDVLISDKRGIRTIAKFIFDNHYKPV